MGSVYEMRSDGRGYRQSQNDGIWHFCSNCSRWPQSNYVEMWAQPNNGEICSECDEKEIEGDCHDDIVPSLYKQT